MVYQIENHMVIDSVFDEVEYGIKHKTRYEREREAFEEAEREDFKDGKYAGCY